MVEARQCQCYKSLKEQDKCCPHPAKSGSAYCGLHQTCKSKEACVGPRPTKSTGQKMTAIKASIVAAAKAAPKPARKTPAKKGSKKGTTNEYLQYLSKRNKELKAQGIADYNERRAKISREWLGKKSSKVPLPEPDEEQLREFEKEAWEWPEDEPETHGGFYRY